MFHAKVVQKIKTHILCLVTFFRETCHLWDNVEKYYRAGQATVSNIIWRMRSACWTIKATDTHSEYVIQSFHGNDGYANAFQCYVCTYIACVVTVWNSFIRHRRIPFAIDRSVSLSVYIPVGYICLKVNCLFREWSCVCQMLHSYFNVTGDGINSNH
jgi:hypothetical protein